MGNSLSIKPQIETAQKVGICQLSKKRLNKFPKKLVKIAKLLRSLDLSENSISKIPSSISNFEDLKHFAMNQNKLASLPVNLGTLKNLERLALSCNLLTSLPPTFGQLTNLRTINLSSNRLTQIPDVFGEMRWLDVLDLTDNKITSISEHVKNMHVVELIMNQNQVSSISEAIIESPRLKILRLEENCLSVSALTPRILSESSIVLLAVDGNVFEMTELHQAEGYDVYMKRYTATNKKMYRVPD